MNPTLLIEATPDADGGYDIVVRMQGSRDVLMSTIHKVLCNEPEITAVILGPLIKICKERGIDCGEMEQLKITVP